MTYAWDSVMTTIRRSTWLRRQRLAMFRLKKLDRILDLGCGDGLDIHILRESGYGHITGVDISETLLSAAKIRNPGVRFVHAPADDLPFSDASFDVILADSMLYHILNSKKSLNEIYRVLSSQGSLCFIEIHNSVIRTLFNRITFSPLAPVIPYLKRRQRAFQVERRLIHKWNETTLLRRLRERGFRKLFLRVHVLSLIGKYGKR